MTDDERYEQETLEHIQSVRSWVGRALENLDARYHAHDQSKLKEPERSGFQAMNADKRLSELVYDSAEYRAVLREHKPTINIHYSRNDHHPEYWAIADPGDEMAEPFYDKALAANGYAIRRMNLMAILEMLCDWKAATLRMKDGDLLRSIEQNQARFGYSDELKAILVNTARELGMAP